MSPRLRIAFSSFTVIAMACLGACGASGLLGLPSPQDGTWIISPTTIGALGSSTWIVQISQDRMVRVNVSNVDWVVQQSFPASRGATNIVWKAVAQPPAGLLLPSVNTEYSLDVMPQADGTLTGTATTGISTIPGIASIPISSFAITMHRT
jgi:hypothetical protein